MKMIKIQNEFELIMIKMMNPVIKFCLFDSIFFSFYCFNLKIFNDNIGFCIYRIKID